ncbi:unnamed protein product [Cyprideis torosa]|uniref:Uncharacterized protein n=1 Tax=Cyprideis torosa TaxID=163714 RepID=A0A7R8WGA5_9CRUS|nr:unnamed protein product [Cyprideis torosa]CAG0896365.1 unnamed protein product [Cyprideis torosa]
MGCLPCQKRQQRLNERPNAVEEGSGDDECKERDGVQEHMRIGLLDPRWVEERDRMVHEKVHGENVYATGKAVEETLAQFAERRTDIFGGADAEAAIGKKIGEEDMEGGWEGDGEPSTSTMEENKGRSARAMAEKEKIGPGRQHPPQPAPPVQRAPPPRTETQPLTQPPLPPIPPTVPSFAPVPAPPPIPQPPMVVLPPQPVVVGFDKRST